LSQARASADLGRFARDGTVAIVIGSAIAGLGAYVWQVWVGRSLGAEAFAPFSALLTIHFLAFAVVLLPVEQIVVRRLSFDPESSAIPSAAVWATLVMAVVAAGFVLGTDDRLFGSDPWFAAAAAATVLTHAVFAVGRGTLAGRWHYRRYGVVSAAAVILRLAATGVAVAIGASAFGLTWTLVLAPLIVLAFRPWADSRRRHPTIERDPESGRLLVGMIIAAAAAQVLLLSGTLVAGLLTEDGVVVSVVFATFTLFRAPLVFGYNLLARVLRPFTTMASEGKFDSLRRWAEALVVGGSLLAAVSGVLGAILGPTIVEIAFGSDFRPTAAFAGLVAAGVVVAGTAMFIGQVLVARGETVRLALSWIVALVAGAAGLFLPADRPDVQVGLAFLIGELVAMALLTFWALRPVRSPSAERQE